MLTSRVKLNGLLRSYIPLASDNILLIGKESDLSVRSNALGIPLVALIQGVIALLGFLIFGVPDPLFWFVITAVGSMIPFVGTALGIIPVTILLFSQDMEWQAIAILIYGVVVVGSTLIFGPLLISLFLLILKIYKTEYGNINDNL